MGKDNEIFNKFYNKLKLKPCYRRKTLLFEQLGSTSLKVKPKYNTANSKGFLYSITSRILTITKLTGDGKLTKNTMSFETSFGSMASIVESHIRANFT